MGVATVMNPLVYGIWWSLQVVSELAVGHLAAVTELFVFKVFSEGDGDTPKEKYSLSYSTTFINVWSKIAINSWDKI